MKDLLGDEVKEPGIFSMTPRERRRYYSRARGYAAPPGTGPEGESCKSCGNCTGYAGGGKTFYKCDLIKRTNGAATDIRLKAPACSRWKPEDRP